MALGQLYYTSCRTGLANSPGYQFNAATPGIAPDLMRQVEALTAYEAPRSLATADVGLDSYPVNLCHLPGETTVVANVEFVGQDYSQRSGNYFAHTLVTRNPRVDLAGCLPIELWGSPLWVNQPVEHPELPELPQPPPRGPLTPEGVVDFLDRGSNSHHLAAMLTAAELAIRQRERKLVIIAGSTETTAYWIAALCYLLPPESVRQLSFMTYSRQPRYSRTAVVGALPEVDIDRGQAGFDTYYLFDLDADQASDLPVHPLARLLADTGVAAGPLLWERVQRFATGKESGFDELYPVAVAASVGWSHRPDPLYVEPLPLVRWLREAAARIDTDLVAAVGDAAATALVDPPHTLPSAARITALRELVSVAAQRGLPQLGSQAEIALADLLLAAPGQELVVLTSDAGRRYAGDQLSRTLLDMQAGNAFEFLLWARRCELRLDNAVLFRAGHSLAGQAVLSGGGEVVAKVMAAWLPVQQGVIDYLNVMAGKEPDRVIEFLAGDKARVLDLSDSELESYGALAEVAIFAGVRAKRRTAIDALCLLIARRQHDGRSPVVDEPLLGRLWRDGCWTSTQALAVLGRLTPVDLEEPAIIAWLDAAVVSLPSFAEREAYVAHAKLCGQLNGTFLMAELGGKASKIVTAVVNAEADVKHLLAAQSESAFKARRQELSKARARHGVAYRQRVDDELLHRQDQLSHKELAGLVAGFATFREMLVAHLMARMAKVDIEAAATMWLLHQVLEGNKAPSAKAAFRDLDRVLVPMLKRWRRKDVRRLRDHLRARRHKSAAAALELWTVTDGRGFVSRVAHSIWARAANRGDKDKDKDKWQQVHDDGDEDEDGDDKPKKA